MTLTVAKGLYLDILGQGVDEWNSWRDTNPKSHANLSGLISLGRISIGLVSPEQN
jgi:hypothetical protein